MADILAKLQSLWAYLSALITEAPNMFNQETGKQWAYTLLVYLALGIVVLYLIKLPRLPDWAKVLLCAGLLFAATSTRGAVERKQLHQELHVQQSRLLDMTWIWEVNIAQVRCERTQLFDYFIRGNAAPVPWAQRPTKSNENDQRAIGAYSYAYTAKVGIDLKQALVRFDHKNKTVYYWIPEPRQTGIVDIDDHWPIRTTLHYVKGNGFFDFSLDWRWREVESGLPLWENVRNEYYRDTFKNLKIDDQLGLRHEADRRLKLLFETFLSYRAVAVSKEQLAEAQSLNTLLPELLEGRDSSVGEHFPVDIPDQKINVLATEQVLHSSTS